MTNLNRTIAPPIKGFGALNIPLPRKITLDNGKTVLCHRDHIWKVSFRKDKDGNPIYELVTTQFMIEHPELEFDIPEVDESIMNQPS